MAETLPNPHRAMPSAQWGADLDTATIAVVAVHGRAQDPSFMHALTDRMDVSNAALLAPHAFENSWYPHPFLEPIEQNQPGLDNSLEVIDDALAHLASRGFHSDRVVLLGFSQGACLVAHYALTHPLPYRALVILTGGFVGPVGTEPATPGRLDGVRVFFGTAAEDGWVPLSRVEETAELFRRQGARVELQVSPGVEHAVSADSIAAATALMQD